jgi:small subunit ribosomal protein S9
MAEETPETQAEDALPEGESPEAVNTPEATAPEPEAEPAASAEPEAEPAASAEAEETPSAPEASAEAEETPSAPEASAEAEETPAAPEASAEAEETPAAPAREKPSVPGADLEVDIVPEGVDPLAGSSADPYAEYEAEETGGSEDELEDVVVAAPIEEVAIDLAAGARYRATGKRKSAIARVILRPGKGEYTINGRSLGEYFPRDTLQRNIRQPLETVGYEEKMDVIARMHGGGVSSQAGALRHGISRALLEADPNLRGELKRRGFLTRDARAKERKKAGLKKARKRPQFSKR